MTLEDRLEFQARPLPAPLDGVLDQIPESPRATFELQFGERRFVVNTVFGEAEYFDEDGQIQVISDYEPEVYRVVKVPPVLRRCLKGIEPTYPWQRFRERLADELRYYGADESTRANAGKEV